MNKSTAIFLVVIVIMAALVLFVFDTSESGPAYSAISTGVRGTSLLFDTLQTMDYPVRMS